MVVVVVQNTYQSALVGCKVREFESTRFGPESVVRWGKAGRSARDWESCASKPNHRFQRFTTNRSTVYYTISGRELHRREIYFRHQTVLSSFSPGLSKAMLGLRLGGLVKNWTIVGFEVKCSLRLPWKGENIKGELSGPVWVLFLRIIWNWWDFEYLSWSRSKEMAGEPLYWPVSSSCKL